jgi:c-di-GMP-binding flagellar brake protein YcgR
MFRPRYTRVRPTRSQPIKVQVMGPRFLDALEARNISRSGVALWMPDAIPGCELDAVVRLLVTLPGERPFIVNGEVRHRTERVDHEECGVEFIQMADHHRALVEAYIAGRLREERSAREQGASGRSDLSRS